MPHLKCPGCQGTIFLIEEGVVGPDGYVSVSTECPICHWKQMLLRFKPKRVERVHEAPSNPGGC